MPGPERIEGIAIVSADDMIADAAGIQPPAMWVEADKHFLAATTAAADVLVHGRHSGNTGASAAARPRIVLTRTVASLAQDSGPVRRVYWNPAGASFEQAWDALGARGTAVVVGGSIVFGMFLERGYDAFHLSRATTTRLPGGLPLFPGIPPASAEALLKQRGLRPGASRVLDAAAALTQVTWQR